MIFRSTAIAACMAGSVALADSVVFDSIPNGNGEFLANASGQYGDAVTLAGTDRRITEIGFLFGATITSLTDVQIRLYSGGVTGTPSDVLWDSGWIAGVSVAQGISEYSFSVPNILATDDITWTVQFSDPRRVGLGLADHPATVGTDYDGFWTRGSFGPWTNAGIEIPGRPGPLFDGFGATIRATSDFPVVPLPTAAWAGLGLLGVAGIARRLRS